MVSSARAGDAPAGVGARRPEALADPHRPAGALPVGVLDAGHKRRKDHVIEDPALQAAMRARLVARLVPEIQRAFQFRASRIERYIVACYDAEEGGWFHPHRDNTTLGTARGSTWSAWFAGNTDTT